MEQHEWIERLRQNPEMLRGLMQSKDGQTLMTMLSGNDGGKALREAAMQAAGGNMVNMTEMVRRITETPDGAALIRRMTEYLQG